ncbi:MAG: hypothetical protein HYS12_17990 [Planctomycetes bacterium]|nr:hypothetical protein [Planctomycetota bacterium]
MSRSLVVALLVLGAGCQNFEGLHRCRRGFVAPTCDESCGAQPGECGPAPCKPPEKPAEKPAEKPREKVGAPAPSTTTTTRTETQQTAGVGAVAQDILLVPRTVYVPYAAQVPVAPARLASVTTTRQTAQGETRETVTEQQAAQGQQAAAPRSEAAQRSEATNEEILRTLQSLNDRLRRLEQRPELCAPQPERCPPPACVPGQGEPLPCPRQ